MNLLVSQHLTWFWFLGFKIDSQTEQEYSGIQSLPGHLPSLRTERAKFIPAPLTSPCSCNKTKSNLRLRNHLTGYGRKTFLQLGDAWARWEKKMFVNQFWLVEDANLISMPPPHPYKTFFSYSSWLVQQKQESMIRQVKDNLGRCFTWSVILPCHGCWVLVVFKYFVSDSFNDVFT